MMKCNACGCVFTEEEAIHEAELAWHRGEQLGDHVCPGYNADDSQIEHWDDEDTLPEGEGEEKEELFVEQGPVRVSWVDLREGHNGAYDPHNPCDEALLRLDLKIYDPKTKQYEEVDSICTCFPADKSLRREKMGALEVLSNLFWEDYHAPGGSDTRNLMDRVSNITAGSIQEYQDLTDTMEIRRMAYERFQLYWLATHGFSMRDVFKSAKEWGQALLDDMLTPEDYSFEAHIDEQGFGHGSLYPCYREFLGAEFCNEGLMKLLLDEEQFAVWEKDPVVLAHKGTDPALVRNIEN